ncbi:hypothetical protein, conserved [Eimeria brunetti]|uniref:Apple domain-containing protein n=1 Tax=Eimeria brunetti TaxID=51314 RepID=U6LQZ6_9EIME|nr:hypothetical protein, conserved [Eimeria brunetti]
MDGRNRYDSWQLGAKKLTGFFVGIDTKTATVKSVTDSVASPQACQTLCKSTKSCQTFTFYIDGRSGANCALKTTFYLNDAFIHPVAVTGTSTATNALGLMGMKFGYEMRNTRMVTPTLKDIKVDFVFEDLFQMTPKVDAMAREACSLLGVKGYAVIDYLNNSAHAVPASGAREVFRPNFNYIDCSKV